MNKQKKTRTKEEIAQGLLKMIYPEYKHVIDKAAKEAKKRTVVTSKRMITLGEED